MRFRKPRGIAYCEFSFASGEALFAIACALPTILAVWFAPALVVFQDCSPARALLESLRAALANWRAVAVYGLTLFFYGAVVPGIAFVLIAGLLPPTIAPYAATLIVVPYFFLLVAAQTISDYVAYRDIFHQGEAVAVAPPEDAKKL